MNELPNLLDIQKIMSVAQEKARRLERANDLEEVSMFIADSSLQECKLIIDDLIDRVSTLVGSATELEDAAASINRCIMRGLPIEDCDESQEEPPKSPMALFSHLRTTGRGV